jgi:hypothetical protein
MRRLVLGLLLGLAGCDSLLETWDGGPNANATGLTCQAADKCQCPACTTGSECAFGIPCNPAKEKGQTCPDSRSVCTFDN